MYEDLILRIEYFVKDLWTSQKSSYFKTGKCEHCGKTYDNLQYAHRDPNHINYPGDIGGSSRGSIHRTLNFIKYPERYYLFCPQCHHEYDSQGSPKEFKINFDTDKRATLNQMREKREKRLIPVGGGIN